MMEGGRMVSHSSQPMHKSAMDAAQATEKWGQLQIAFDQIYRMNQSPLSFQSLYTTCYQITLHKHGDVIYEKLVAFLRAKIGGQRESAAAAHDNTFLDAVLQQWDKHSVAVAMIADIMMYMDKNFVPQHKKLPVKALGLQLFGDLLLKHSAIKPRLRTLCLQTIENERNGDAPHRFTLKSLCTMMSTVDKRDVFEALMEGPFLTATAEYYRREAADLVSCSTTPAFIAKLFARLHEEQDRVHRCLDEGTLTKVEAVILDNFMRPHMSTLMDKPDSGCGVMLRENQVKELRSLYEALMLCKGVALLTAAVREYLLKTGHAIVTDPSVGKNPAQFVDKLIQLHTRMWVLMKDAFYDVNPNGTRRINRDVEVEVIRAFEDVINQNTACPEYLSLYIDQKLRVPSSSVDEDTDFDTCCDQVICIFRFLREKDIFEQTYKVHLGKRLLSTRHGSSAEEKERVFIAKLKKECGSIMTSKIEGMFNDRRTSEELMDVFRQKLATRGDKLPIELQVSVLTSGFWPTLATNSAVVLPPECERCVAVFRQYYLSRHTGRTLTFQNAVGSMDVRLSTASRKYELNVPVLMMPVLQYFSPKDVTTATIGEICTATGLPLPDAARVVAGLLRAAATHTALLTVQNGAEGGANVLKESTVVAFNQDFKAKHVKIRLLLGGAAGVAKERDEESRDNRVRIDEDRKYKVDAAIVRIMKYRKRMEHRLLVADVIGLLKNSFSPTPDDIKRRIEHLIEREFLERTSESRSTYNYLA